MLGKVRLLSYVTVLFVAVTSSFGANAQECNMLSDTYYEWTVKERVELHKGLTYTSYSWDNIPRNMNVLEVDLSCKDVELVPVFADDMVPNPNGNRNRLNGFCIRERLSDICVRYNDSLNQDVVAGINSCGFDSHNGYPRGLIVCDGVPLYQNDPAIRRRYSYPHSWCMAVFKNRRAAVGQKEFSGKVRFGRKEYEYFSINDITLRQVNKDFPVNIYTSLYKQNPHGRFVNELADSAVVYIVAEYVRGPMKVNEGYAKAKVLRVYDGLCGRLTELPYVDSPSEVVVQMSGKPAEDAVAGLSVGDHISLRADVSVGGVSKPISVLVTSLHRFLHDGVDVSSDNLGPDDSNLTTHNPMTFVTISKDGRKLWLVEVDGRSKKSRGMKSVEMAQTSLRLGGWNMTRFDGGGSSAMWVRDCGGLVSVPSDRKGERSCLNYILVRVSSD